MLPVCTPFVHRGAGSSVHMELRRFHFCHSFLLRVSALHYLARDRVSKGFRTVASARVLCQPTSCRSEYFYNQCPQVWNLIGTEHSLNRSERRVKKEAS